MNPDIFNMPELKIINDRMIGVPDGEIELRDDRIKQNGMILPGAALLQIVAAVTLLSKLTTLVSVLQDLFNC
jgi:hypothetical protein